MQLFYCNKFENNKAELSLEETKHCKVLRKKEGDHLKVIDGQGHLYTCILICYKAKNAELEVINIENIGPSRSYYFHLVIAPTKQNDRMEWMLEKAIEVGLDEISFIETEHSEKNRLNLERLQKIALSAIKQSNQFTLPIFHPICKLNELKIEGTVYFAHCKEDKDKIKIRDIVKNTNKHPSITILIGPEGDFSENEIEFLLQKKMIALDLGPTRLRTETAGLYCSMALSALF